MSETKLRDTMNLTTLKRQFMSHLFSGQERRDAIQNLEGKSIRVSVAENPPLVMISRGPDGIITSIQGYLADIWYLLEQRHNFRTVFVDAGKGFLGENKNGTWNGLMGNLQMKKADVGLANLLISTERKQAVDFSAAIDFDSSKFLSFSDSNYEAVDWLTFTTTLSWGILICVGVLWFASSLFVAYSTRNKSRRFYFDYIFSMFGAITMQGSEMVPTEFHGRTVFIIFWFMCIVVNTSFTALLTTHLTTATYKPFSSLGEALDAGLKVSAIRGTVQYLSITEATTGNADFRRIAQMFEKDPSLVVDSVIQGVQQTFDGKTLFLYDSSLIRYAISDNCSFTFQPMTYFAGYLHLAYRKHFPFQEAFDTSIIRFTSSGVVRKLVFKWFPMNVDCVVVKNDTPSLGLGKTLFAFVTVFIGTVVSLFFLAIELGLRKWRDKNKTKKQRLGKALRTTSTIFNQNFEKEMVKKLKNDKNYGHYFY